jgi:hypothetical protein
VQSAPGWTGRSLFDPRSELQSGTQLDSPPHWSLKLRKGTSLSQTKQELQIKQAPVININNSQGIQIGDRNIQHIASSLQGLIEKIDQSSASPQEKHEAKGLVARLLENPTVASLLGGAISGAIGLLK